MRRVLLFLAAVGVAGALAIPAGAVTTPPVLGVAYGAFRTALNESAAFTAVDRGLPANDFGVIRYCNNTAGFCYVARLVCVSVVGNTARFGYVIPNQPGVPAGIVGLNIVWTVADNGPGAPLDTAGYSVVANATLCDATVTPTTPITQGNIVVRQGPFFVPGPGGDGDDD
jgi:hypothetical protein